MYKLKFSLLTIVISSIWTVNSAWISSEPIINVAPVLFDVRLLSTMIWNLSGIPMKPFKKPWNHLMATLHSSFNVYFKLSAVVAILLKLLYLKIYKLIPLQKQEKIVK